LIGKHFSECSLLKINGQDPTKYNNFWNQLYENSNGEALAAVNAFYKELRQTLAKLEHSKKITPTLKKNAFHWIETSAYPPETAWEHQPLYAAWLPGSKAVA